MISSATESGEFKDVKGTVPFMAPEVGMTNDIPPYIVSSVAVVTY